MDPIAINIEKLQITGHAWTAMTKRGVSVAELAEALTSPDIVEPDNTSSSPRRRYVRGELAFVVARGWNDPEVTVVITVLWRRPEQWTSEAMRRR